MTKEIQLSEIFEKSDGLFDYIARRELDYCEPQRQGTPRGEKIGFTTKKYLASLLVGLTNFKLKKLAGDLDKKYGLSYGLIKKWRTEKDFKKACEDHAEEFADFLIEKMRSWVFEEAKEYFEHPEIVADDWRIFKDAAILSDAVINHLFFKVFVEGLKGLEKIEGDAYILEGLALYKVMTLIRLAEGGQPDYRVSLMAAKGAVARIKELISSKRVLSKREQGMIVGLLEGVERNLGGIIEGGLH